MRLVVYDPWGGQKSDDRRLSIVFLLSMVLEVDGTECYNLTITPSLLCLRVAGGHLVSHVTGLSCRDRGGFSALHVDIERNAPKKVDG